jgi:hypothetical protein
MSLWLSDFVATLFDRLSRNVLPSDLDDPVGCNGETSGFCIVCLPAFVLAGIPRAFEIVAPAVSAFLAFASFPDRLLCGGLAEKAGPLGGAMR